MKNEFQGKTALVTGASRGIGAATAIALARAGCGRVLLHNNSGAEGVAKIDGIRRRKATALQSYNC